MLWLAVGLGCLLCSPSLWLGFVADDVSHRRFVLDHLASEAAPGAWWNMFDLLGRTDPLQVTRLVMAGLLPWWTSLQLEASFLRPLATASHYLDYLLWPDAPWAMHLHNIAWYGAIVLLAGLTYRRLLGAGAAAGLAVLFFAVDTAHVDGTAWLAGRNTLLTAAFALLTLLLFDYARRDASRWATWLAPLALLCAHASSEGAISVWAYLIGYALFVDRGPPLARVRALVPLLLVSAAWVALGTHAGYGVRNSGVYADPRREPGFFLAVAAERLPQLWRAQLGLPIELTRVWQPSTQHAVALATNALIFALACVFLPLAWRRASTRLLLLGALGSALVACAGGLEPRLLFLMGFGVHGLLGELVTLLHAQLRAAAPARRAAYAGAIGAVLLLHLVVPLPLAPLTHQIFVAFDRQIRQGVYSLPRGPKLGGSAIVVLNADTQMLMSFVRVYWDELPGPKPSLLHVLGTSGTPVKLSRSAWDSIVLEPEGGYLLEPSSLLVRRTSERFTAGQSFVVSGVIVHVERVTADGRPARVRFQIALPSDPRWLWVAWNGPRARFERIALPKVGQSVMLPRATRP